MIKTLNYDFCDIQKTRSSKFGMNVRFNIKMLATNGF